MNPSTPHTDGVAIIGMAGRFPKAKDIDAFWENLRSGRNCISFLTEEKTAPAGVAFIRGNPNYVNARGVLENADLFDAAFFGINPREAQVLDPQHRVFLECAWEALESAGYDSEREARPIGVFAGMSMNTYLIANLLSRSELLTQLGAYQLMLANDKDFLPTRVSYKLNLRGPSMNVQTACSTTLVAVCTACQSLLTYQCDMALAGGVSITFPQDSRHLFQEGGIASRDGYCRAFDARAQGTVGGEGVGIVVLKRVSDALADGDEILAVIKGFAINNDGGAKVGYSAPSEIGQAEAIAWAQAMAGFDPATIGYLEAHGTGTALGDPIEIAALTRAFRAGTDARNFCALASVKTAIGHLDVAAGIAGLISATLALQHKTLPPSLNFEQPNPQIDFGSSPFFVNTSATEWKAGATPRRAGVSSFGIGGTNAHVVLEEAPPSETGATPRPAQLLLLSARTESALNTATANLAAHLRSQPGANLADVAHTLQVGRRAFNHRRMLVCSSVDDAVEALDARDVTRVLTRVHESGKPTVAFMFSGQGAQRIHMGRELYQVEPAFRREVDHCAELLAPALGRNLRDVLYPATDRGESARQEIKETFITQPALFVLEYALAKLWLSWGIQPQAMIGHSIGEYVAACLAGVFSLPDALRLVATRGRLMQDLPRGAMLAVRASEAQIAPLLTTQLSLASINGPVQCVVSGETGAIEEFSRKLARSGTASHRLETSHAFHSPMVESAMPALAATVRELTLHPPRVPFISNVTGTWISDDEAISPDYWSRHMRETVRFADGLAELFKEPARALLEIGPGQTLAALARQHPVKGERHLILNSLPSAQAPQHDTATMLDALGRLWMAGMPLDWAGFYAHERRRRVRLPTYPFERKRFWIEPAPVERTPATEESSARAHEPENPRDGRLPENGACEGRKPEDPVLAELKALFGQLSGIDLSRCEGERTFVELGFDSLALTQACHTIESKFGVRVPFGSLLQELPTFESLTAHLKSTGGNGAQTAAEPGIRPRQSSPADASVIRPARRRQITPANATETSAQLDVPATNVPPAGIANP